MNLKTFMNKISAERNNQTQNMDTNERDSISMSHRPQIADVKRDHEDDLKRRKADVEFNWARGRVEREQADAKLWESISRKLNVSPTNQPGRERTEAEIREDEACCNTIAISAGLLVATAAFWPGAITTSVVLYNMDGNLEEKEKNTDANNTTRTPLQEKLLKDKQEAQKEKPISSLEQKLLQKMKEFKPPQLG